MSLRKRIVITRFNAERGVIPPERLTREEQDLAAAEAAHTVLVAWAGDLDLEEWDG